VLTTVSVKLDAAGHLRFIVTEGRIAAVKLDGDIGPAGVQVLRFLNRLTETTPIDSLTLERYLLLAQDVPGVTVRAVLQPSTDQPGALTLIAQVSRKEIGGSISADNRAFNQTGPYETLGVLDFNSYTSLGEKTELSYYHTFPNSQNFGQVSEEFFVGSSGLKVKIYAGYGQVNPTGQLGQSGYQGTTTVFGTQVTYPVIRTRQQTLNVFAAFDGLESRICGCCGWARITSAPTPGWAAIGRRSTRLRSGYRRVCRSWAPPPTAHPQSRRGSMSGPTSPSSTSNSAAPKRCSARGTGRRWH
jgi:hemolysin activation/secretion protein